MSIDRDRQSGFSLLEVLVAFAILAMSMTVIFQSFSLGARGVIKTGTLDLATDLASTKLDEIGNTIPLNEGIIEGRLEHTDLTWRAIIRPFDVEENKEARKAKNWGGIDPKVLAFHVTVEVFAAGRRGPHLVRLESLKIRPAAAS